ncbi:MAG: CoA-binding protein [Anaerolineae bacterium]
MTKSKCDKVDVNMMTPTSEQETIQKILQDSHTVAVVGLSSNPERPSYDVAHYLQQRGYRIIPVNPNETEVLGERAYPDLLSIPEPIDVVDIFRRPEAVPPIVEQAIQIGAKAVWMQKGVRHEEAAARAREAGLLVVMDRCMMAETRRLIAEGLLADSKS